MPKIEQSSESDIKRRQELGTAVLSIEGQEEKGKPEMSALSYRYTYNQDVENKGSNPSPTQYRTLTKPLRDKNVRNMRLRPRQVLCSRCKQACHDTLVPNNTTTTTQPHVEPAVPPQGSVSVEEPLKLDVRKRKGFPQPGPVINNSPKKLRKAELIQSGPKTSPVIRISFASPQGKDTVLKIPPRSHTYNAEETPEPADTEKLEDATKLTYQEYKKAKKALKKAKERVRQKSDQTKEKTKECTITESTNVKVHHHHRHSHKHKLKHKRKHKEKKIHDEMQENVNHDKNSHNLNCVYNSPNSNRAPSYIVYNENGLDANFEYDSSNQSIVSSESKHPDFKDLAVEYEDRNCENSSRLSMTSSGNSNCADSGSESNSNSDTQEEYHFPKEAALKHSEIVDTKPLMMRIQTRTVTKCTLPDQRSLCAGDIVWGKIHGFPWWPGKIISITVSQRDNGVVIKQYAHVSWFGSSTMSHMPCSELFPFLDDFKLRYNKKKRGPYKQAIKQATLAAQSLCHDLTDIDLSTLD